MNNEGYVYHFFFKCKGKPAFTGTKSNKSVKVKVITFRKKNDYLSKNINKILFMMCLQKAL